jgi:hypothetical protein
MESALTRIFNLLLVLAPSSPLETNPIWINTCSSRRVFLP